MENCFRMRALSQRVGMPASAIRFYVKEGLVPAPERPTPNSALYGEAHVTALVSLKTLKSLAPEMPLAQLKRVMELIDQGVEPGVALALHRAVALPGKSAGANTPLDRKGLAKETGTSRSFIDRLVTDGLLVPVEEGGKERFYGPDREVVTMFAELEKMAPDIANRVARISNLLREASAIEMDVRNSVTRGTDLELAAQISTRMQNWGNFWHNYLFARFRLQDIAREGLGIDVNAK